MVEWRITGDEQLQSGPLIILHKYSKTLNFTKSHPCLQKGIAFSWLQLQIEMGLGS